MKDKDRYWDCLDQAMEASHGGRTDEALAWLDEALRAHPEGAEAHNGRGEILWDEGKVEEAVHEFERALRADPKFITAHLNRAELLVEDLHPQAERLGLELRLESADVGLVPVDARMVEKIVLNLVGNALKFTPPGGSVDVVLRKEGDEAVIEALTGEIDLAGDEDDDDDDISVGSFVDDRPRGEAAEITPMRMVEEIRKLRRIQEALIRKGLMKEDEIGSSD